MGRLGVKTETTLTMPHAISSTVFLAGSTAEVISALACIRGLRIEEAAIFVERNISFGGGTMDPLLAAARRAFPEIAFIELRLNRPATSTGFGARLQRTQSLREQIDAACRLEFGGSLAQARALVREVYFTALHDYVQVFLAVCKKSKRILYPHGFDHPRLQQTRDTPYLLNQRGMRTVLPTLPAQWREFKPGGLAQGVFGRVARRAAVCLPFSGVDCVITFREGIDYVSNELVRVKTLEETFRWLLGEPPWVELLHSRKAPPGGAMLLLLSEYNRHPIWEENRNYGPSHLHLVREVRRQTGATKVVIKAHVRSDGSAAQWMADYVRANEEVAAEVLPTALHGIPVEALALTGEFIAACSLGSCSLPPGLGFGMPHFVSSEASSLFDKGWVTPFWAEYSEVVRVLVKEGICKEVERSGDTASSSERKSAPQNPKSGRA